MASGTGPDSDRASSRRLRQLEMSRKFAEQARGELQVALMLVQPGGYHAAAEQARLATELSLKALLWSWEGRGIRGHNVAELLQLAEMRVGPAPPNVQDAVYLLRTVTAETRYPEAAKPLPLHRFKESDAVACISAAHEVLRWVDETLKPKGEETH